MHLVDFTIAEDSIALRRGSDYFDLHNCFDFRALDYDFAKQSLELKWSRCDGQWVKYSEPAWLRIVFTGVYLFKAQERDAELPFSEDDCLESIGFIWNNMLSEMRAYSSNQPCDGRTHLNVNFMSGFSINIGATSATLHVASSV